MCLYCSVVWQIFPSSNNQQVLQLESSSDILLADHHSHTLQLNSNDPSINIMNPMETSESRSFNSQLPTLTHFTDSISQVFNYFNTFFCLTFKSSYFHLQQSWSYFYFVFSFLHFLKMIYIALFIWGLRKTISVNWTMFIQLVFKVRKLTSIIIIISISFYYERL